MLKGMYVVTTPAANHSLRTINCAARTLACPCQENEFMQEGHIHAVANLLRAPVVVVEVRFASMHGRAL